MKYKVYIEFESDQKLSTNELNHSNQVLSTRLCMEAQEMIINRMNIKANNVEASIIRED